jgi:hypothetical protein
MSDQFCFRLTVGSDVHSFPVNKRQLVTQLNFFQQNPSFLSVNEYSVKSEVSISAFSQFVRFIEGSPIEITTVNLESFERLSEEFDFQRLRNSCASFSELKNSKMNHFFVIVFLMLKNAPFLWIGQ